MSCRETPPSCKCTLCEEMESDCTSRAGGARKRNIIKRISFAVRTFRNRSLRILNIWNHNALAKEPQRRKGRSGNSLTPTVQPITVVIVPDRLLRARSLSQLFHLVGRNVRLKFPFKCHFSVRRSRPHLQPNASVDFIGNGDGGGFVFRGTVAFESSSSGGICRWRPFVPVTSATQNRFMSHSKGALAPSGKGEGGDRDGGVERNLFRVCFLRWHSERERCTLCTCCRWRCS